MPTESGPPAGVAEAEALQLSLRERVDLTNHVQASPSLVAGLDVSYDKNSSRVVAAAVVLDVATLETVDVALADGIAEFPYVPGLLAFREVPLLLDALDKLTVAPDVLVCDGYGVAHPRRFGLASHVGVVTGRPSFGVAKTPFLATFDEPGQARGDWSTLVDSGEVLGRVLRTQTGVRPVFVSVGHRIGLPEATELTLRLCRRYRLPESTRRADFLSRQSLRELR
jgi:deoxyribonuclease V